MKPTKENTLYLTIKQVYFDAIVAGQKKEEYREIINKNLRNWDMDRVTDVDMIILQMALAELLSFPTIPTTVTLNEYIELAKIYSTAESGVFVNGLLDSALHQLRNERRILKF